MENALTTADFLALENRGFGYGYGRDYRGHSAASTTGIGLAAGLGGGALLLAIAGLWGINKASEARNQGALTGLAGLSAAMTSMNNRITNTHNTLEGAMANERASRENWQCSNMPSVQSYIDVRATPSQNVMTSAQAAAEAAAFAQLYNGNNGGINSAIGSENFLRVQRYSAPQPCGCDSCGCNG